jgi:hypothetical protein
MLEKHMTNILVVEDWLDQGMSKEVHRATVDRFMILLDGGNDDGKLRIFKTTKGASGA